MLFKGFLCEYIKPPCGILEVMKNLLIIFALLISHDVSASSYPGKAPDCWTQPRAVHTNEETDDYVSKHISITKNTVIEVKQLEYVSPNKGYSFSYVDDRPDGMITINAEKHHFTVIELKNIFGLSEIKWVNENLVFFRIYLGQEVFIDVLFNVESERIIFSQSGRNSKSAMQQFEQGCKLHGGCECIKKQKGTSKLP